MLQSGDRLELAIEKPAAGGRMIARHEGQVVLVSGAIPGERVTARIERVERRLAFAGVESVLERSPDRRDTSADPLCGGCLFAHISIERQRSIKAEIVADAFARIGRYPLGGEVAMAPSPERGYRMRARLHVRGARAGFYREGTHELCDPAATGQLLPESSAAAALVVQVLDAACVPATAMEVAENMAVDQRAIQVEAAATGRLSTADLETLLGPELTSISVRVSGGQSVAAGVATIADPLEALTRGRAAGTLQRSASSFFQANRFLLPELVTGVMDAVRPEGEVLDLYAGVGLFAVALAGTGRRGITAVEGHEGSGADLRRNAEPFASTLEVAVDSVEAHLAARRALPPTVIVDPPRTGLSKPVVEALASRGDARIVYISCDPPTLARDARALLDGGYRLTSVRAFDLFPNTPHVETLAVFER
jgi:tRNA/tmRNA/rRNA uracil-C5-methylase (TrmA/RlmC/RlmD family)